MATDSAVPRLTYLRIKNYRALRDVEFRDLTPLTVLIGPNGSGKSTVLDALDFLAEAVRGNLVQAWEKRNRFRGMRTRGSEESIEFEVKITHDSNKDSLDYQIEFDENEEMIWVVSEAVVLKEGAHKSQWVFFSENYDFADSAKIHTYSKNPLDTEFIRRTEPLLSFRKNPSINPFSKFDNAIQGFAKSIFGLLDSYRRINLTDEHLGGISDAGPRERLSANGDNLPNVLYYYHQRHPEVLGRISEKLREWVPGLAEVVPEITSDERLLLRFKDAPFEKPLPAQYMSGGTMRLAALLALLYEPGAGGLLGIEEPENELHPQLLPRLAEELEQAAAQRQLLVATHSPAILNGLEPEQVWILHRSPDGYTQATRVADLPGIAELVAEGSPLGYLWSRNYFEVGNPLAGAKAAGDN